jgi:MATE family multidrug resistance protein
MGNANNSKEAGTVEASRHAGFLSQLATLLRLAAPIALSRFGALMLVIVDAAMLGHTDSRGLAYYGLGNAVAMVPFLIGIGMMIGVAVLTAQARGAGRDQECGPIWRVGLYHALAMGGVFAVLSLAGEGFLAAIGQEPALVRGGGRVMVVIAVGLPGAFAFICSTLFLEALNRPRPGLVVMVAANLVNAALNWLLLDGWPDFGLDAAAGVALATSVTRWLMALALIVYLFRLPEAGHYRIRGRLADGWRISAKLRRLGYAYGLAHGLESMAFSSLSLLAGYLGLAAVAGYQIVINVIAFAFMGAVGVATATGVAVGHAVGAGDSGGVARAGWSGLATILIFMGAVAVAIVLLPEPLGRIFTNDPEVLAVIVPTLLVAGYMLLADGAQAVLMGALRGAGDVWVPTILHLCAFILVMMPVAWWLALPQGYGTPGLMMGAFAGVTVAALLLGGRFALISRRRVRRL